MEKISFVIPCYNSEHTVADVIGREMYSENWQRRIKRSKCCLSQETLVSILP